MLDESYFSRLVLILAGSVCVIWQFVLVQTYARVVLYQFSTVLRPAGAQTVWLLRFMLQLTTLLSTLLYVVTTQTNKKTPFLPYRSICYEGIVTNGWSTRVEPSKKNTTMVEPFAGSSGLARAN